MNPPPLPNKDRDHLRLLVIGHYVAAGLMVPGLGFLALHYGIMNGVFGNPEFWQKVKEPPPFDPMMIMGVMRWLYLGFGLMMVVSGVLTLMAGRRIAQRRGRTFTMVIAALNCMNFPLGMLLGIFTLIVLSRESVERLYVAERVE